MKGCITMCHLNHLECWADEASSSSRACPHSVMLERRKPVPECWKWRSQLFLREPCFSFSAPLVSNFGWKAFPTENSQNKAIQFTVVTKTPTCPFPEKKCKAESPFPLWPFWSGTSIPRSKPPTYTTDLAIPDTWVALHQDESVHFHRATFVGDMR